MHHCTYNDRQFKSTALLIKCIRRRSGGLSRRAALWPQWSCAPLSLCSQKTTLLWTVCDYTTLWICLSVNNDSKTQEHFPGTLMCCCQVTTLRLSKEGKSNSGRTTLSIDQPNFASTTNVHPTMKQQPHYCIRNVACCEFSCGPYFTTFYKSVLVLGPPLIFKASICIFKVLAKKFYFLNR